MGKKWHRDIEVVEVDGRHQLHVSVPENGNPSGRGDSADFIRMKKSDRKDGGGQVRYKAKTRGLKLTGMTLCLGSHDEGLSSEVRGRGKQLRLTDTGPKGVTYRYQVLGSFDGYSIATPDPEIHNEDDD